MQKRVNILTDEADAIEKANNISKTKLSLELQIAEYSKNYSNVAAIVSKQRAEELKAMDESLRPLQQRIYAIQDEKAAYDQAVNVAENAYNKVVAAANKQKDAINKSYDLAVSSEKARAELEIDAAKKRLAIAEDNVKAIETVFDAISKAIDSTKIESESINKQRRISAQSLIRSAGQSGADVTKIPGLNEALSDVSKTSEQYFSTFEEFAMDQAATKNNLDALQSNARTQLDFAKLTVDRLESTIESIQASSEAILSALAIQRDNDIAAVDASLELARTQIDILKGIDTSILSLNDALKLVANSLQSIKPLPGPSLPSTVPTTGTSVTDSIKGLYRTYLGREFDQQGLEWWTEKAKSGLSLADMAKGFMNSPEYKALHSFDVGTNYIPSDMMAMVHEGERIIPKSDNAELMRRLDKSDEGMSGSEAVAILREIKDVIMSGDLATNQKLSEIVKIERKWDNEGLPEERDTAI